MICHLCGCVSLGTLHTHSSVMIEGYNIYRNDRNQQGGGVAFYVKETIPDPIIKIKSDSLEIICLEVAPKNGKSFYVICWYRPPTNEIDISTFEKVRDIIKKLEQDEKRYKL